MTVAEVGVLILVERIILRDFRLKKGLPASHSGNPFEVFLALSIYLLFESSSSLETASSFMVT